MGNDYYNRSDTQDGRDDRPGRGYSSARDYEAAGIIGPDRNDGSSRDDGRRGYGARDHGQRDDDHDRYAQRDHYAQRDRYGRDRDGRGDDGRGQNDRDGNMSSQRGSRGPSSHGRPLYDADRGGRYQSGQSGEARGGARDYYRGDTGYRGAYASDDRRFEDVGRHRQADDDDRSRQRDDGRQPQGYDGEERGFFQRAGDEVRSWFGDDDAERRREMDSRHDERAYGGGRHDEDYHSWRSGQIAALDRDYDEYRRENRSRFENEFATWRTTRQGQRDQLTRVQEHQEVVGSDGAHVGTVDKVKGDRILLTRNDVDAGGQHHSIPSSWITSVDDKVTLAKTAADAKQAWRDEDRNSAMFNDGDNARQQGSQDQGQNRDAQGGNARTGRAQANGDTVSGGTASGSTTAGSTTAGGTTVSGAGDDARGGDRSSFPGTS